MVQTALSPGDVQTVPPHQGRRTAPMPQTAPMAPFLAAPRRRRHAIPRVMQTPSTQRAEDVDNATKPMRTTAG